MKRGSPSRTDEATMSTQPSGHKDDNALEGRDPARCLSVRDLARYWRVAPAKVRQYIRRGLLVAIDFGSPGCRRLRITPEAIRECERLLAVQARPPRRRRQPDGIDPEVAELLGGE
jgi:hypothetical protein